MEILFQRAVGVGDAEVVVVKVTGAGVTSDVPSRAASPSASRPAGVAVLSGRVKLATDTDAPGKGVTDGVGVGDADGAGVGAAAMVPNPIVPAARMRTGGRK